MDLRIVADRAVAQNRPLGDLCADGGERHTLVPLHHGPAAAAQQRGLELFLEIAVEETVDDRVDAGGDHGSEVAQREDDVMAARRDELVVPVKHRVEDVEREPGEGESHDYGD